MQVVSIALESAQLSVKGRKFGKGFVKLSEPVFVVRIHYVDREHFIRFISIGFLKAFPGFAGITAVAWLFTRTYAYLTTTFGTDINSGTTLAYTYNISTMMGSYVIRFVLIVFY